MVYVCVVYVCGVCDVCGVYVWCGVCDVCGVCGVCDVCGVCGVCVCGVLLFSLFADCIFKILPMQRYSAQEQYIKATQTSPTTKSMPDIVILQKLGVSVT